MPVISEQLKPIDTVNGFQIRPGFFREFGAVAIPGGVNFTIHTHGAISCELLLFHRKAEEPYAVIPFPESYRIGFCYSMIVFDLDIEEFGTPIDWMVLMMKRKDSVLIKTKSCWILMHVQSPDRASGDM